MDKADLKEKLIILSITAGVFLPIRLALTSIVSDDWLGSLGLMTIFAILLVFLIKRKKLGKIGIMFERQIRKTIGGKTGKYIILFALFFLVYFGTTLFLIERGNTIYEEDKGIFYYAIIGEKGYNIDEISTYSLNGPIILKNTNYENLQSIANLDYVFSIAYGVMNDMSQKWISHFVIVMFIEQIELIGLLFFYRNTFKPVLNVQSN
jgi:hypothetical protein